jgi:hypothetical protein
MLPPTTWHSLVFHVCITAVEENLPLRCLVTTDRRSRSLGDRENLVAYRRPVLKLDSPIYFGVWFCLEAYWRTLRSFGNLVRNIGRESSLVIFRSADSFHCISRFSTSKSLTGEVVYVPAMSSPNIYASPSSFLISWSLSHYEQC